MKLRLLIVAFATLVSTWFFLDSGSAPSRAQTGAACDSAEPIRACRAQVSVQGRWATIQSSDRECSRVDWLRDGHPQTTIVRGGQAAVELFGAPTQSVEVQNCTVYRELAARMAAPERPPAQPSRARANIASFFANADYPAAALANREQGTVRFRLSIGSDGSVTSCAVVESSGSAALDSATCEIMRSRGRFTPARTAEGYPTTDTVVARITWRLPEDPS